ncbi:MAG: SIMPL domain-containing protein [Candidatus Bilamarchaeaceae archaeon]
MVETKYVVERNTAFLMVLLTAIVVAGATYIITSWQAGGAHIFPAVVPAQNCSNTSEEVPKISVNGEAARVVKPDLLIIGLTIETENETASLAEAANAKATAALKAALLARGIKESEIQTTSYYTYPIYNDSCWCPPWPCKGDVCPVYETAGGEGIAVESEMYPIPPPYPCECNREIIGYRTTHSIMIKSENISVGGSVIDGVADVTSTRFDYFYFSLKEQTRIDIENELIADAAKAARKKAESIATGLGVSLGRIVLIQTDYYPPYYPYGYVESKMPTIEDGARTSAEIFPQDLTLSSHVYAIYEIKQ